MRTLIAALVLIVCAPFVAEARECAAWGRRHVCWEDVFSHQRCAYRSYCRRWHDHYESRPTRVYSYERRSDAREIELIREADPRAPYPGCKPIKIRATGDDKLEEERAKVSAQDRFSVEAETHFGTLYSDVRNAARLTESCIRKVPTSATEKGQATMGVRHWVCIVEGIPCPPPKEQKDEDSRAKRRSER